MTSDLKDKVFIVTGAGSGIGLATTRLFLEAGARVFGADLRPGVIIEGFGDDKFKFFQCNLTEPNAPNDVVEQCIATFGSVIHGLCNVAGIVDHYSSADTLVDDIWERTLAVNLTVPVYLMRAVLPHMLKAGGGRIANVSSKAGMSGAVAGIAYTASKHGLIGATKNVAWSFKDQGIRCNAIAPGVVATNIGASLDHSKVDMAAYEKSKPIVDPHVAKGVAAAEEPAKVLAFLMSDASAHINGVVLPVDNAWSTI